MGCVWFIYRNMEPRYWLVPGNVISDVNGSLGSRQFLNVANERTCFASCACTFKSTWLFTRLKRSSD